MPHVLELIKESRLDAEEEDERSAALAGAPLRVDPGLRSARELRVRGICRRAVFCVFAAVLLMAARRRSRERDDQGCHAPYSRIEICR